jgi:hypothetical protein
VKKLVPPNKVLAGTRIEFNNQSEIRNHMLQAVNTVCLAKLRGCDNDAELMPVLREITSQANPH